MWKVSVASFRLSEKAIRNLEAYAEKVTKKSKNLTLNIILEELSEAPKQSEQPQKKEGWEEFLKLPPFLYCDQENKWLLRDNLLDPHNPVGCLKSPCQKTCPAWRHKALF